ncbi:MAG: MarR family winged helix-turn-helix transcriptional regulator [Ignavibacteria bacterium]
MTARIVDLIMTLKTRCADREERIRNEFSLSPAEYKVLITIHEGEHYNCNALSQKLGLSVSRASRIIEKLIKRKYLTRKTLKGDRRHIIITLAPKGMRVQKEIQNVLDDCEQVIQKVLTKSEINSTYKIFAKLENCL